jgi:hypothetical protein
LACPETNKSKKYIPKSNGGKPRKAVTRLKAWSTKYANQVADPISQWDTHSSQVIKEENQNFNKDC